MNGRSTLLAILTAGLLLGACTTQRPVDAMRADGDRFFKQAEYAAAADEYGQIAARYPGDWRAQHMLGRSLLQLGRLNDARSALEIAHTRRPSDPDVVDDLAETMFRQGEADRLFSFLRDRAEGTQSVRAYLRLARYAQRLNDPDSARLAVDTAIQLEGNEGVNARLAAAALAVELGDPELGVLRLREAYTIDPNDERVRQGLRDLGEVPGPTLTLEPGASASP